MCGGDGGGGEGGRRVEGVACAQLCAAHPLLPLGLTICIVKVMKAVAQAIHLVSCTKAGQVPR